MRKTDRYKVTYEGQDNLSPAAKRAKKSTDDLDRASKGLRGSFGQLGTAAKAAMPFLTGAAVIAGMKKMITMTADAGDKFAKMSQKLGISVETLSTFDHVAKLSGITIDVVAVGMRRFAQNAIDMSRGIGEAKREFELMGISVKDSDGNIREMEDLLLEVADRFSKMEDGTLKTATAMRLFGRSGSEMIPMLNKGKGGLREMMEEAKRLGLVFSKESAQAMEQFNDNMTRLQNGLRGLTFFIGNKVIPVFTELLEEMGFGTQKTLPEQYQKAIRGAREEIERLEGIVSGESAWAKLNRTFMTTGAIEQTKARIADLKAEIRLYTQHLEKTAKPHKDLRDSMDNTTDAASKLEGPITKLRQEYNNLFLTEKEQLELWQQEQLAIKGINEEMVNAIYNRKLVSMVTKEIVDKNKEVATTNRELMEQYQESTLSDRELLDVWRDKMLAIDGVNTKLLEGVYAIQAWKMEQEGIIGFGPVMPGYKEEWIDQMDEMGEASSSFREAAVSNLAQVQSSMQTTFSALAAGSEAWKGALIGLLATLVHSLITMGMKKRKEMVAGSAEHSAKAAESAAEQDWVGVVLHAIAAALFGTAAGRWGSVGKGHMGMMIGRRAGLRSDEVPIIAQTGEGLLSRKGVTAIGGPEVVEAANRGMSIGSQSIIVTNNMGGINNITDVEEIGVVIGEKILSTIRESA